MDEQAKEPQAGPGPPGMVQKMGDLLDNAFLTHAEQLVTIRRQVGMMVPMVFEWGRVRGREQIAAQVRDGSPN